MRKLLCVAAAALMISSCQTNQVATRHKKVKFKVPEPIHIELSVLSTYKTGRFDESAAEIIAYDAKNRSLVFTNADENTLEFVNISNPKRPRRTKKVSFSKIKGAGGVNSVAIHNDLIAAAVEHKNKQNIGFVVFLNTRGRILNHVRVGSLPDMVTFTPNGKYVVVANEGEPNSSYDVDPLGSVSIIDISKGSANAEVNTITFEDAPLKGNVRITALSPDTTIDQDLEPEYVTISDDSKFAFVALQENNAVAKVDIEKGTVISVTGLGYKDHSKSENALDASSKDKKVNITTWPVRGLYMPDAITSYTVGGATFLLTANEGDGREYGDYTDETKVGKVKLDKKAFPKAKQLQSKKNLAGLLISSTDGDSDNDGDYDALYTFGARSFSIWDENLYQVYDSGDAFEQIIWRDIKEKYFNTSNDKDKFDNRSPKKGPEPEGITLGKIGDNTFAFILLERIGGVMVYNISNPYEPQFEQYINNRIFGGKMKAGKAGDLGPEDAVFISKSDSPNGTNLLAVANEVSGSVTIYNIKVLDQI